MAVVAGLLRWLVGGGRSGVARSVVVVSGLPRSGTSMIMGMLAAGGMEALADGARAPDDDNPRGYFELERVKQLHTGIDTAWIRDARGKCVKVISYFLKASPPRRALSHRVRPAESRGSAGVAAQDAGAPR